MKQIPSHHQFVVLVEPQERELAAQRLAPLGTVHDLEGSGSLLLSLPAPSESPEAVSKDAADRLEHGTVQPVLLDEEGNPHYPTGEITIRFRTPVEEADLRRFAAEHGLRLLRRNEFAPQQAVFQPLDAARSYLPGVIGKLEREQDAKAVWANTVSRYQRLESC